MAALVFLGPAEKPQRASVKQERAFVHETR